MGSRGQVTRYPLRCCHSRTAISIGHWCNYALRERPPRAYFESRLPLRQWFWSEFHAVLRSSMLIITLLFLQLDMVLSPLASYAVDIFHTRSAESMAVHTYVHIRSRCLTALNMTSLMSRGFRSLVLALATTLILPSINHIGILGTNAIAAGAAWMGFGWVQFHIINMCSEPN